MFLAIFEYLLDVVVWGIVGEVLEDIDDMSSGNLTTVVTCECGSPVFFGGLLGDLGLPDHPKGPI